MTIRFDELPDPPEPRTSEDMLRELCERQTAEIRKLRQERDDADRAVLKFVAAHTIDSRTRQANLDELLTKVEGLKATTLAVVKQRDTIETALRRLAAAIEQCTRLGGVPEATQVVEKIWREAVELLTVIDQLKAAEKNKPES